MIAPSQPKRPLVRVFVAGNEDEPACLVIVDQMKADMHPLGRAEVLRESAIRGVAFYLKDRRQLHLHGFKYHGAVVRDGATGYESYYQFGHGKAGNLPDYLDRFMRDVKARLKT